jgi:hypothetical protein
VLHLEPVKNSRGRRTEQSPRASFVHRLTSAFARPFAATGTHLVLDGSAAYFAGRTTTTLAHLHTFRISCLQLSKTHAIFGDYASGVNRGRTCFSYRVKHYGGGPAMTSSLSAPLRTHDISVLVPAGTPGGPITREAHLSPTILNRTL